MSRIYKIKTDIKINLNNIFDYLVNEYPNLSVEKRGENYVYFYLYGMSTRGVDVSWVDYGYEIKNAVLSNKADISLAFKIIMYITTLTKSMAHDEGGRIIPPEYFTNEEKRGFKHDLITMFAFIEHTGKTMEFPGPTRSIFIGKNIYNENKDYENNLDAVSEKIENIFFKILYGLPEYMECGLIGVDNNEEDKVMKLKLITSDENYLIQNYDYLIIGDVNETKNEEMVMINIEKIRSVLPEGWEIIDECTIAASKLSLSNWKIFKEKCKELNCYDEFSKKAK